jgi:hypothetical protein
VRGMSEQAAGKLSINRMLLIRAAAAIALLVPVALGVLWTKPSHTDNAAAEGMGLKFSAVSIRQNKSGGPQVFGKLTPNGYEMRNMFLAAAILTAYVPRTGGARTYSDEQVVGLPHWLESDDDRYDLDAKVDEADLPDWQDSTKQPALLQAMLDEI